MILWKIVDRLTYSQFFLHKKETLFVNKNWKSGKNKKFSHQCEKMCVECEKTVEEKRGEKTLYK